MLNLLLELELDDDGRQELQDWLIAERGMLQYDAIRLSDKELVERAKRHRDGRRILDYNCIEY